MNPTAQEIRAARDVAEGKILEAVREFEGMSGCVVRDLELVRVCTTGKGDAGPQSLPVVMLDVDLGRMQVVR